MRPLASLLLLALAGCYGAIPDAEITVEVAVSGAPARVTALVVELTPEGGAARTKRPDLGPGRGAQVLFERVPAGPAAVAVTALAGAEVVDRRTVRGTVAATTRLRLSVDLACAMATCTSLSAACGTWDDGCGGEVACGGCTLPATCGGGGAPKACGCTAESDGAFCTRLGKGCGSVTAADNCGASRTASCGACSLPQSCGGGGTANVCGCNPCTPPAPSGLTASPGDGQVTLTWSPVSSFAVSSYALYWSTAPGVTKTSGTRLSPATSPYVHTGRTNGAALYYIVTATNSFGEGPASSSTGATPAAPPAAPGGVVATPGNAAVTLTWNAVSGAVSYNAYWATAPGVTKGNGSKLTGVTSPYTHTGCANGTTCYYVLTAVGPGGEGAQSAQASATPLAPPPAPANLQASPRDGAVQLNWNAVAGASSYAFYWSTSPGVSKATGTKVTSAVNSYLHPGRANGTTYYYVATAANALWEGPESAETSATPQPPLPAAPAGLGASARDGAVLLSWTAASGADSHNLYWSTTAGVTKANGSKVAGVVNPYLHQGRSNGTPYSYVVVGANGAGEGPESPEASAVPQPPPPAPASLAATPGDGQITLAWAAAATATGYNVYWSPSTGVTPASGTKLTVSAGPFTHTGRANGVPVYYVVTATNSSGESGPSPEASATPQPPPPAPTGVSAAPGTGQVTVSWSPVAGATGYNLYWSASPGVSKSSGKVAGVTSPYPHARPGGTAAWYAVTALAVGESALSAEVSATSTWVAQSFPSPGSRCKGMAWDGTAMRFMDNLKNIYRVDTNGQALGSVSTTVDGQDLAWDGASLWTGTPGGLVQFAPDGSTSSTLAGVFYWWQSGFTWDGAAWWVGNYNSSSMHKHSPAGAELLNWDTNFFGHPTGVTWDGSGLWIGGSAEYGNHIYRFTPQGAVTADLDLTKAGLTATPGTFLCLAWDGAALWYSPADQLVIYRLQVP